MVNPGLMGGSRAGFMNPSPVPPQMQAGMGAPMRIGMSTPGTTYMKPPNPVPPQMSTGWWNPGQTALPPMTTGGQPTPTALPGTGTQADPYMLGGWSGQRGGMPGGEQMRTWGNPGMNPLQQGYSAPQSNLAPNLPGGGGMEPFIQQYLARLQSMGPQRGAQDQMSGHRYMPQTMDNSFRTMGWGMYR